MNQRTITFWEPDIQSVTEHLDRLVGHHINDDVGFDVVNETMEKIDCFQIVAGRDVGFDVVVVITTSCHQ